MKLLVSCMRETTCFRLSTHVLAKEKKVKLSSIYSPDMTFNDVVEQLSSLTETIKQMNASFKCMSKEIEELKEQISHLNQ